MSLPHEDEVRWMSGNPKDKLRNQNICQKLEVVPYEDKMSKSCFGWFSHRTTKPLYARARKFKTKLLQGPEDNLGREGQTWDYLINGGYSHTPVTPH